MPEHAPKQLTENPWISRRIEEERIRKHIDFFRKMLIPRIEAFQEINPMDGEGDQLIRRERTARTKLARVKNAILKENEWEEDEDGGMEISGTLYAEDLQMCLEDAKNILEKTHGNPYLLKQRNEALLSATKAIYERAGMLLCNNRAQEISSKTVVIPSHETHKEALRKFCEEVKKFIAEVEQYDA